MGGAFSSVAALVVASRRLGNGCTCRSRPKRITDVARGDASGCDDPRCLCRTVMQVRAIASGVRAAEKAVAHLADDFLVLVCDGSDGRYCAIDARELSPSIAQGFVPGVYQWSDRTPSLKYVRRAATSHAVRHAPTSSIFGLIVFLNGICVVMCRRDAMQLAPQWFDMVLMVDRS